MNRCVDGGGYGRQLIGSCRVSWWLQALLLFAGGWLLVGCSTLPSNTAEPQSGTTDAELESADPMAEWGHKIDGRPRRHADVLHVGTVTDRIVAGSQPAAGISAGSPWTMVAAEVLARQWIAARYPATGDPNDGLEPSLMRDVAEQRKSERQADEVWLDVPLPTLGDVEYRAAYGRMHWLVAEVSAPGGWLRAETDDAPVRPVAATQETRVHMLVGARADGNWQMAGLFLESDAPTPGGSADSATRWQDLSLSSACIALIGLIAECEQDEPSTLAGGPPVLAVIGQSSFRLPSIFVVDTGEPCSPTDHWEPFDRGQGTGPRADPPAVVHSVGGVNVNAVADPGVPSRWVAEILNPDTGLVGAGWHRCAADLGLSETAPRLGNLEQTWSSLLAGMPEGSGGVEMRGLPHEVDGAGRQMMGVWLTAPETQMVEIQDGPSVVSAEVRFVGHDLRFSHAEPAPGGSQVTPSGAEGIIGEADALLATVWATDQTEVSANLYWEATAEFRWPGVEVTPVSVDLGQVLVTDIIRPEILKESDLSRNGDSLMVRAESGDDMSVEPQIDSIDGQSRQDAPDTADSVNGPWASGSVLPVLTALGAIAVMLLVVAFMLGRSKGGDGQTIDHSIDDVASADSQGAAGGGSTSATEDEDSVYATATLEAVAAWQLFYAEADLSGVRATFDSQGPQYQTFADEAVDLQPVAVTMSAEVVGETSVAGVRVVTASVAVDDGSPEEHLYNFVYRRSESQVWNIHERPAGQRYIAADDQRVAEVEAIWAELVDALNAEDAAGVAQLVTPETRELAQLLYLSSDSSNSGEANGIVDPVAFQRLAGVAVAESHESPNDTLLWLVGGPRLTLMDSAELAIWSAPSSGRIRGGLWVDGNELAVVPFQKLGDNWVFDLASAVNAELSEESELVAG